MLHRLLVPLDGSPLSEKAVPIAARIARPGDSSIVLMRALEVRHLASTGPSKTGKATPINAEDALTGVGDGLRAQGLEVEHHVIYDDPSFNDPARGILHAVQEYGTDAIVMSTHGRTGIARMIDGSVAENVLHKSPVPVVVVPANTEVDWTADDAGERRCVLVPLDGSDTAEAALGPACWLADRLGVDLLLMESIPPPVVVGPEGAAYMPIEPEEEVEAIDSYLNDVAERLRKDGRTVDTFSAHGSPFTTIADTAHERGALAIAMATHGHTGVARLVMGGVAKSVVQYGRRPVLLIRPSSMRADATSA
jgi:nucleotide-binding universal stress UspA family protein